MQNSSVLLFFIDGLGIGDRNDFNPFFTIENVEPLAFFKSENPSVIFDGVMIPTDACLGVEGRPQSASGQTTILTGINAPQFLGYHKQGFPNAALREILAKHSIFRQLENFNITPNIFANAYTPQFFTETPRWKSATTAAVESSKTVKFKTLEDMKNGEAIFMDFTNSVLRARSFDADLRTPQEAGKILARISSKNRFTLYEYFITDKIGHDQDFQLAKKVLPDLAEFLRTVLQETDLQNTTVIMTSDHGNIEDLSKRNHTLNNVPTVVWGKYRNEISAQIKSLVDITPSIIKILSDFQN